MKKYNIFYKLSLLLICGMFSSLKGESIPHFRETRSWVSEPGEASKKEERPSFMGSVVEGVKSEVYGRVLGIIFIVALITTICLVFGVSMEISTFFINQWGCPSFISDGVLSYGSLIISIVALITVCLIENRKMKKKVTEQGEVGLAEGDTKMGLTTFFKVLVYTFCYAVNIINALLLACIGIERLRIRGQSFEDYFQEVTVKVKEDSLSGNGLGKEYQMILLKSLLKKDDREKRELESFEVRKQLGFEDDFNSKYLLPNRDEVCCICGDEEELGNEGTAEVVVHGQCAGSYHAECLAEWVKSESFACPYCGEALPMTATFLTKRYTNNPYSIDEERKNILRHKGIGGQLVLRNIGLLQRIIDLAKLIKEKLSHSSSEGVSSYLKEFLLLLKSADLNMQALSDFNSFLSNLGYFVENPDLLTEESRQAISEVADAILISSNEGMASGIKVARMPVLRYSIDMFMTIADLLSN